MEELRQYLMEEDPATTFPVTAIKDHDVVDGQVYYLVAWANTPIYPGMDIVQIQRWLHPEFGPRFHPEESCISWFDTWEPVDNLRCCEALSEYHLMEQKKMEAKSARLDSRMKSLKTEKSALAADLNRKKTAFDELARSHSKLRRALSAATRDARRNGNLGSSNSSSAAVQGIVSSGPKKFACRICSAQFSNVHNLSRHFLLHKNVNYSCQLCSKSFKNRKDNLKRHLKVCKAIKQE